MLDPIFSSVVLQCTGATSMQVTEVIQDLWSGYGQILLVALTGGKTDTVIVKHVRAGQSTRNHPRGWATDIGHRRKVKSYQIEGHWYKTYSAKSLARLPACLAVEIHDGDMIVVLEDLDAAGYHLRKQTLTWSGVEACLSWLAYFHATYLGCQPQGLWEVGTYWHLATRPQELEQLNDPDLKHAAASIDRVLTTCEYQTFVHGDAKLANFCFADDGAVAGLDFQYVGGGCGMKDVAYFIGSCLRETDCDLLEAKILDTYFGHLSEALGQRHEALEREWRSLYPFAWADFHRFIKGWSPSHWKINSYSERISRAVIERLQ